MQWLVFSAAIFLALVMGQAFTPETARADPGCTDGTQGSGALYRICMPATWNGTLFVYARGAIYPQNPLSIQDPVLIPGPPEVTLSQMLNSQGFAFATSSYRRSGLAVLEGVDDLHELVELFSQEVGTPSHVIIGGFSEGGFISILSVERLPDVYDGGLAGCTGGSLKAGIDYAGDVRAVFDYFFPNMIPGNALDVPRQVIRNWDDRYGPRIRQALLDHPHELEQIMAAAGVPAQAAGLEANVDAVVVLLQGEVSQVADYTHRLGGRPYDNHDRQYTGSDDDVKLNRRIHRYKADRPALAELENYEATGALTRPLVTLHTTGDFLVPYRAAVDYAARTAGNPLHVAIAVERDGHCTFTATEVQQALGLLLSYVLP